MPITILHLSHISNYTPPMGYGGIELVVDTLARLQAKFNHRVKVIGIRPPRYRPTYEYINVFNEPLARPGIRHKIRYSHLLFKYSKEVDIIHSHVQWILPSMILLKMARKPVVITLHADPGNKLLFKYASKLGLVLVAISKTQKERLEKSGLIIKEYIHLGLELDRYPFNRMKEDYLLYVGRIDRSKGTHVAVRSARKSGYKLFIIGPVVDIEYFYNNVKPYIDNRSIIYLGEVDFDTKVKYLMRAKALLYPVQYEEFFGLAIVEALACGTPVIGFAKGSVIEIVRDGVTGFTVRDEDELVSAIKRVDMIDPLECRRDVENRFSAESMVMKYSELYSKIVRTDRKT